MSIDSLIVQGLYAYRSKKWKLEGLSDYYITYVKLLVPYIAAYTAHKLTSRRMIPDTYELEKEARAGRVVVSFSNLVINGAPLVHLMFSSYIPVELLMVLARAFKRAGILMIVDPHWKSAYLRIGISRDVLLKGSRERFFRIFSKVFADTPKLVKRECRRCGGSTFNQCGVCSYCLHYVVKREIKKYAETMDPSVINTFKLSRGNYDYLLGIDPIRDVNRRWIREHGEICFMCGRELYASKWLRSEEVLACPECRRLFNPVIAKAYLENGLATYDNLAEVLGVEHS